MPGKDGYYKGSMVYIQYLIVAGMLLAAVFYLAFNMLPGFADNKENKMDDQSRWKKDQIPSFF